MSISFDVETSEKKIREFFKDVGGARHNHKKLMSHIFLSINSFNGTGSGT